MRLPDKQRVDRATGTGKWLPDADGIKLVSGVGVPALPEAEREVLLGWARTSTGRHSLGSVSLA
jgi:hypothetical protein